MHPDLASLPELHDSFLGHRLRSNPSYGFMPHYLFFLENHKRWYGSADIQRRILAPVSEDQEAAWKEWRQFRSAQAEVTAAYLVEKLLGKCVRDLEVCRPGYTKSCDIRTSFDGQTDSYLEVKAQSGQQHGSRHPLSHEAYSFTPQGEDDLRSWLFEPRVSQATGGAMTPYCLQASAKGADVLVAMIDIMQFETAGLHELGRTLVPDCLTESLEPISATPDSGELIVSSFTAGAGTTNSMGALREIWLFNESSLDRLLVIHAHGKPQVLSPANA